jgi:hypothetical protein
MLHCDIFAAAAVSPTDILSICATQHTFISTSKPRIASKSDMATGTKRLDGFESNHLIPKG